MPEAKKKTGIFIYGNDLTDEGELGPGTLRRLKGAMAIHYSEQKCEFVLAPGFSPDIPNQTVTMREQMAQYLRVAGFENYRQVEAATFDTTGEMNAFCALGYTTEVHVSHWWHIPRIKLMRKNREIPPGTTLVYHGVAGLPSLKSALFEPAKVFAYLMFPKSARQWLKTRIKKVGRTSW